jgi:CheY-like chemotaxis protein
MARKPAILCVDDQVANLSIRMRMLEMFGCETIAAYDHQSALHIVTERPVDLVLIDYHLGNGETGDAIAHDVRVLRPEIPLIMLTGDSHLPDHLAALVDAVLIKGVTNPGALLDLIQELLPKAELRPHRPTPFSKLEKPWQTNS